MAEKKQELEKRLQDVTGQLGSAKKAAKKGKQKTTRPHRAQLHLMLASPEHLFLNPNFNVESLQLKMQLQANWMQLYRLPVMLYHRRVRAQVIHRHRVPATVVRAIRATVKQVRISKQYTQKHTYTHTSNWKYRKIHIYIIGKYIYVFREDISLAYAWNERTKKTFLNWVDSFDLRKKEWNEANCIK